MATKHQQALFRLWAANTDFTLDPQKSPKAEFARLAIVRGWIGGDDNWKSHWLECFNDPYPYSPRKPSSILPAVQRSEQIPAAFLDSSSPKVFFALFDFAFNEHADVKSEFFRFCHSRCTQVGTSSWRRNWKKCFNQPWDAALFGGYIENGPATELQRLCFSVYAGFTLVKDVPVGKEFARLAKEQDWNQKDLARERRWCLGNTEPEVECNDNVSVSNSEPASPIFTPATSEDGSHRGGVTIPSEASPTIIDGSGSKYWAKFPDFQLDPTAPLATKFSQLTIHQNWSNRSKKQPRRRAEAYEAEFEYAFQIGADKNTLETWQDLSKEVGIETIPTSITQCRKALKSNNALVNLVNLIDHRCNPQTIPLIKFASYKKFLDFTREGHIFPKKWAKEDGFIKALLRHVF